MWGRFWKLTFQSFVILFLQNLNLGKVQKLIKPKKKYRRAQVISTLAEITTKAITKVGREALAQMTSFKKLNVLPRHQEAFERGLGFEVGQFLFSRYSIYTDGMFTQIKECLNKVRLSPGDPIKMEDWMPTSPISKEMEYSKLLKFDS